MTAKFNSRSASALAPPAALDQDDNGECWNVDGRGYGGGRWGGDFGGAFARYEPDYLWPERGYGESRRGYELLCTGGHGYSGAGPFASVPPWRVRDVRHGRGDRQKRGWFNCARDKLLSWLSNKGAGLRPKGHSSELQPATRGQQRHRSAGTTVSVGAVHLGVGDRET